MVVFVSFSVRIIPVSPVFIVVCVLASKSICGFQN